MLHGPGADAGTQTGSLDDADSVTRMKHRLRTKKKAKRFIHCRKVTSEPSQPRSGNLFNPITAFMIQNTGPRRMAPYLLGLGHQKAAYPAINGAIGGSGTNAADCAEGIQEVAGVVTPDSNAQIAPKCRVTSLYCRF